MRSLRGEGERPLTDVVALIPARNEEPVIGATLCALARQGEGLKIVVQSLGEIWEMASRAAFYQLGESTIWLALCTLLMIIAFLVPVLGLVMGSLWLKGLAALALLLMMLSYWPTLRFYDFDFGWGLTLAPAGLLYLAITWYSAIGCWRGTRARWKGRIYARNGRSERVLTR
jgi:hypothetical protein